MRQTFIVSGMTCAACSARVEKVTKAVPGVVSAEVNLLAGTMTAEISDPKAVERIIQAVAAAGYEAQTGDKKQKDEGKSKTKEENMTLRLVGSALFTLVLMYFTMGHMFGLPMPGWYHGLENAMVAVLVQFFLTLPVIIWNRAYYIISRKSQPGYPDCRWFRLRLDLRSCSHVSHGVCDGSRRLGYGAFLCTKSLF